MAHFIAEAIRAHIGDPQTNSDRALLAVVDKCEQMRDAGGIVPGWAFANTFEGVIVRELDVAFPAYQAAEARRLLDL